MKSKVLHYIKEIVVFVIFITVFSNAVSFYKSSDLKKDSLNVINITLNNGEAYNFSDSKPLLIHFWATWCPTCSVEASNIEFISKKYEVITIAVKSDAKEIEKYMKENDLTFRVVNDENAIYAQEFKIAAYPTTFIYDKDKNLVFSEVGYTSTFGLWIRMWWSSL